MDDRLKHRMVGAVVLVALAVIFVPMLLDSPDDGMGTEGSNLPPLPEPIVQKRIEPLELPPPEFEPPGEEPVLEARAPSEPEPPVHAEADQPESGPVAEASFSSAESPVVAAAPPVPPLPAPAEETAAARPDTKGWVVQLGSFRDKGRALALQKKLRGMGYTAFVEQAEGKGVTWYRVRVGPELERANADRLRDKLATDTSLKGLVTRYP